MQSAAVLIIHGGMDRRIALALTRIDDHIAAPLSLNRLAADVHLSPSRFSHLFVQEVGTSPARYLRALRMLRACVLLERTVLSVKEVMLRVGCHDPSHFSRDFHRFHGVPPSALREGRDVAPPDPVRLLLSADRPATVASIARLANERLLSPRTVRPRARSPGLLDAGRWNLIAH